MAAAPKDNSGLISENDRKEKDSHPDMKGKAMVDGVEYWVSGWNKDGQYGPYISLAFTRKDSTPKGNAPEQTNKTPLAYMTGRSGGDDDCPF